MTETYTRQQMFNIVYNYFIHNKSPLSYAEEGDFCYYRGPNGTRCAAGLLIKDKDYIPYMEGKSFWIIGHYIPYIKQEDHNFVGELQGAHDDAARLASFVDNPLDFMENRLRNLAKKELLYIPSQEICKREPKFRLWKKGEFLFPQLGLY